MGEIVSRLYAVRQLVISPTGFCNSDSADLYIFCDASEVAYGSVVYIIQGRKPVFLISKAKVAPTVTKSHLTLELLPMYLTLKCLKNICKALTFRICL